LRRAGLAVSTINTYASELSLFIKFLAEFQIEFSAVDDEVLIDFADGLILNKISGSHINRLLLRVINYLVWYQRIFLVVDLVGEPGRGCPITISTQSIRTRRGAVSGKIKHMSMVPASTPRTVRPISLESVGKLVAACDLIGRTRFKRVRDRCMLTLLADAGLRREELTWVRCERVRAAADNGGRLMVRTSKRRNHPDRELPIPQETLNLLIDYLDVARAVQIRRLKGRAPHFEDDGWAFCTRSGRKMAPATISQIFSDLRERSDVKGCATAHMFRHRYITLQVVSRLRALKKSNIGLEAMTTILSKVASLSGHGSLESLWVYVDWAFDELESMTAEVASPNALEIVDRLLHEAKGEGDQRLITMLESILVPLLEDQRPTPQPSVLTHSLRKT
jgi:site-specific recombinase XerD